MSTPRYSLSPGALMLWRFLRDSGGYWTPGDIAEALMPGDNIKLASTRTSRWLFSLQARQCVSLNPRSIRRKSFGVTARCMPPEGESMTLFDNVGSATEHGGAAT